VFAWLDDILDGITHLTSSALHLLAAETRTPVLTPS